VPATAIVQTTIPFTTSQVGTVPVPRFVIVALVATSTGGQPAGCTGRGPQATPINSE
jgi:hypothetical protein